VRQKRGGDPDVSNGVHVEALRGHEDSERTGGQGVQGDKGLFPMAGPKAEGVVSIQRMRLLYLRNSVKNYDE
jgi:hypothetical protein